MGRNLALWIVIGLAIIAFFNLFQQYDPREKVTSLPYSEFVSKVTSSQVSEVVVRGPKLSGKLSDGSPFSTDAPNDPGLVQKMLDNNVKVTAAPIESGSSSFLHYFLSFLPMILIIGATFYMMRGMQGGGNKAMGFGRSKAKLMGETGGKITFDDVAGVDEAKEELEEIVDFLKDPQKFQRLGGKIPKGALLIGPPGTGKTLLARAIAGEAGVPFFSISGSDFVEMFVGVGASRVRDMFEQGKKNAPCIIFIDEIDAVGRHRGAGLGGGNDEREQTLNQLLVEMDGFESNEGVILVAATNRPDVLDPALLRPGRFDRQVYVSNPDLNGREKILKVHMKKIALTPGVDPRVIARGTPGFSGADLANLVNEAALLAARKGLKSVNLQELEEAKDKVMMGAERRTMVMSDEERSLTAYHESGHAIVAHHLPASDPIHKATIIPRGRALGMVVRLPEGDRVSMSRIKLQADLAVAMGGRIAEELIFGYDKVTTGASSDFRMASDMARRMVMEWGMSDKMGTVAYGAPSQEVFLGHSVAQSKNISESTAQEIDQEVRKIVDLGYKTAKDLLVKYNDQLHLLAKTLLERETLTGEQITALLKGESIDIVPDPEDPQPTPPEGPKPKKTRKPKLEVVTP